MLAVGAGGLAWGSRRRLARVLLGSFNIYVSLLLLLLLSIFTRRELCRRRLWLLLYLSWCRLYLSWHLHLSLLRLLLLLWLIDSLRLALGWQLLLRMMMLMLMLMLHMRTSALVGIMTCGLSSRWWLHIRLRLLLLWWQRLRLCRHGNSCWRQLLLLCNGLLLLHHRYCCLYRWHLHFLSGCNTQGGNGRSCHSAAHFAGIAYTCWTSKGIGSQKAIIDIL